MNYKDLVGTSLDKLAQLITTAFLKATAFPIAVCLVVNALLWRLHRGQDLPEIFAAEASGVSIGAAWALLLAVFVFTWNALLPFLRDVLRGRYGWVFRKTFIDSLERARSETEREIDRRIFERTQIEEATAGWISFLQAQRKNGVELGARAADAPATNEPAENVPELIAVRIRNLEGSTEGLFGELQELVDELGSALAERSADLEPRLAADHMALITALRTSRERLTAEAARLHVWLQFHFPQGALSPTRYGNVTRSIATYAETRYGLSFDFFWSRIQRSLDDATVKSLAQTQADSDFFVSLVWLSLLTVVAWLGLLVADAGAPTLFLSVALLGPVAVWGAYQMAVRTNGAFADQVKAVLDTERGRLWSRLGMSPPADLPSEKARWEMLYQWLAYGEDAPIGYSGRKPAS